MLKRLPASKRRPLLEGLQELLGAVRGATEDCCPGAFDHLMEEFPQGTACGDESGQLLLKRPSRGAPTHSDESPG